MNIDEKDIAKLLISSSPEGILVVNREGDIIFVNDALISMFGYGDEKELLGKKMELLIPQKYSHTHTKSRKHFSDNPSERKMGSNKVLYGKRKNNTEFAVEVGLNYIKTDERIYISALISDISERIAIQDELKKLNLALEEKVEIRTQELENAILELQELNKNLEEQYDKTKKAEHEAKIALRKEKELGELKSRFVSMASHEFRTPLSTVLSSNRLIQKYLEKEDINADSKNKIDKHNNRITKSINNLNEILNDLLSLGKIEEGKIDSKKDNFCTKELIEELIEDMSGYLKSGQYITSSIKGESIIHSDRHLIYNILINLTSNASKYSNEDSEIKIECIHENNTLILKVIDHGIGIPKEEYEHMFDRFFRAKNATNIQGTGLGLNIVKKYLELIKGNIIFTSEINVGSTFTVTIDLS